MGWFIEFDIAAFIIIAIILGLFIVKKNYPSRVNQMYLYLMIAGLLSSLTDVASVYAIVYARQIPIWVNLLVNTLFLLCMNVIPFIYYFYVDAVINEFEELDKWHEWPMRVIAVLDLMLIGTSPFTGLVFYFNEQRDYCSGPLKVIVYGIAVFVLVACLFKTFRNREILSRTQKNCVYLYTLLNVAVVIIQIFYPKLLITNFALAIAFMIIYIMLQRPENKIDSLTMLENRVAFLQELNREIYNKKPFWLLAVKIDNLHSINERIGINLCNAVLRQFSLVLTEASEDANVYRISGAKFVYIRQSQEEIQ